MALPPPGSLVFPYTTLFRSPDSLLITRFARFTPGWKFRFDVDVLNAGPTDKNPLFPQDAAPGGTAVTLSAAALAPAGTPDDPPVTCNVRLPCAGIADVVRVSTNRLGAVGENVEPLVAVVK